MEGSISKKRAREETEDVSGAGSPVANGGEAAANDLGMMAGQPSTASQIHPSLLENNNEDGSTTDDKALAAQQLLASLYGQQYPSAGNTAQAATNAAMQPAVQGNSKVTATPTSLPTAASLNGLSASDLAAILQVSGNAATTTPSQNMSAEQAVVHLANALMGGTSQSNVQAAPTTLQSLGFKYQQMVDESDRQQLEVARRTRSVMELSVSVYSVPPRMQQPDQLPAVTLELPCSCNLGYVKRCISRLSGGTIYPSAQRLFVGETGDPMTGDHNPISYWQLPSGSLLYLAIGDDSSADDDDDGSPSSAQQQQQQQQQQEAADVSSPATLAGNPATAAGLLQQALSNPAQVAALQQLLGGSTGYLGNGASNTANLGGLVLPMSGSGAGAGTQSAGYNSTSLQAAAAAAAQAILQQSANAGGLQGLSALSGLASAGVPKTSAGGSASKKTAAKDSGKQSAPRQRFTEEEIAALVEGVRLYGTSWTRIKSAFSQQLARRTQLNLKDKWRNLQRGMANNWRDERSHISDETKQRIRDLTIQLNQHVGGGSMSSLPADSSGMNLQAAVAGGADLAGMDAHDVDMAAAGHHAVAGLDMSSELLAAAAAAALHASGQQ